MPDNKRFTRVLAQDSNGMVMFFAFGSSRIRFLATGKAFDYLCQSLKPNLPLGRLPPSTFQVTANTRIRRLFSEDQHVLCLQAGCHNIVLRAKSAILFCLSESEVWTGHQVLSLPDLSDSGQTELGNLNRLTNTIGKLNPSQCQ